MNEQIAIKPFVCKRCNRACQALGGMKSDCCGYDCYFKGDKKEQKEIIQVGL